MEDNDSPASIAVRRGSLSVHLLHPEAFDAHDREFHQAPEFSSAYALEDYIEEKRRTEDKVRDACFAFWTPYEDFEVATDENHAFTMHGRVFHPRVLCREYLGILFGILQSTRMKDNWMYNTSVEWDGAGGQPGGAFTLYRSTILVLRTQLAFDLVRCLSRSRAEAENEGYSIVNRGGMALVL